VSRQQPDGTQGYDLLVVRQDGEVKCLGGEDLEEKWTSLASAIGRDEALATAVKNHTVLYAAVTNAATASKGILRGRQDVLASFPQEVSADGYNPEILVLVTKPADAQRLRILHVLALPTVSAASTLAGTKSVQTLLSTKLPRPDKKQPYADNIYDLHVPSGVLNELSGEFVNTYTLTDTFPTIQTKVLSEPSESFLRLSTTSIVTSSREAINVYNSKYMSLQSSIPITAAQDSESRSRKRKSLNDDLATDLGPCKLVSYFTKSNTLVAISGNDLVGLQLDTQEDRPGKRRATGLLIDALGCGLHRRRTDDVQFKPVHLVSFGTFLPHSGSETLAKDTADMDSSVNEQDIEQFEALLAGHLGMKRDEKELEAWKSSGEKGTKPVPTWKWPARKAYPAYDQHWVLYALSRIFSWSKEPLNTDFGSALDGRLIIDFYPHNAITWLIETGNFTIPTIESALKHHARLAPHQSIPSGQLVDALVDLDPEMKLLLLFLENNYLSAPELLHAIRLLMKSLEIFTDKTPAAGLLTNGEDVDLVNGDAEAAIEREEAEAEEALQMAEYHLGDGSSIRGQALSLSLSKLYAHPSPAITAALQSTLTATQTVSLIHLLRFELARGSWTSRYLDIDQAVANDETETSNNTIVLISSLLNNCIDAIGAGGWLFGDAKLVNGDQYESEELIESLKLEVSAALECIEEAAYLKGLTAEIVRYGEAVQNAIPADEKKKKTETDSEQVWSRNARPMLVPTGEKASSILPFGLKAEQQVSKYRVGAGGEVKARSMRDIGRLKSQKVEKYSLERIVI
jgi:hypothetical protein